MGDCDFSLPCGDAIAEKLFCISSKLISLYLIPTVYLFTVNTKHRSIIKFVVSLTLKAKYQIFYDYSLDLTQFPLFIDLTQLIQAAAVCLQSTPEYTDVVIISEHSSLKKPKRVGEIN